jgi:putative DNA primase/helicase
MLIGDPGLGKSLLTIDCAARLTRGTAFPDGAPCELGSVILLSAEDDPADTIRPRLDAAGADVHRVHALDAVRVILTDGTAAEKTFSLETDIAHMEDTLRQDPSIRLIVIDPISAYLGGTDSHRNSEVRGLLTPLAAMAARHDVAILGVSHFRKSEGPAIHRANSSIAFVAAARAAWGVAPHPDDASRRVMLPIKQNLAPDTGGLTFEVEAPNGTPCLKWGDAVSMDANVVLGGSENREERGKLQEAKEWLGEVLSDGPIAAKEIRGKAKALGFSDATIDRAKADLGVVAEKSGFGMGASWRWKLPDEGPQPIHTNLRAFDKPAEAKADNTNRLDEEHEGTHHLRAFGGSRPTGPPPTPIPCAHCGEIQPSRTVYARHLDSCGKR